MVFMGVPPMREATVRGTAGPVRTETVLKTSGETPEPRQSPSHLEPRATPKPEPLLFRRPCLPEYDARMDHFGDQARAGHSQRLTQCYNWGTAPVRGEVRS